MTKTIQREILIPQPREQVWRVLCDTACLEQARQVDAVVRGPRRFSMDTEKKISALKAIIAEERGQGCPMADELLIEPALRRWRSYARRLKRHKDKSVEHRAQDLEKGLLDWCENHGYGYDPGCIHHLAQSFAKVLFHGVEGTSEQGA
jgi:hypothetical protein